MEDSFKNNEFKAQLLSYGCYLDDATGTDRLYLVEAYTVRLNHVALNAWILSECLNVRECYEDGEKGDAQWEAHKAEYRAKREGWNARIMAALDIDSTVGSVKITQVQTEVFTVVHIRELRVA